MNVHIVPAAVRVCLVVAALSGWAAANPSAAAEGPRACEVRSDYDLTVGPALLFERVPAAQRIEMQGGRLAVNGVRVPLPEGDRTRIAAYESSMRALMPRIKTLGQRAVDLGAAAVREEAIAVSRKSAANPKLNARVEARARDLKARIANSSSTKEWRGAAFNRYSADIVADILPLVAADLAQEALELAVKGDLAGAAALQKRAAGLRTSLETRIRDRLQALEPEIAQLCPEARKLDALESALNARLPDESRLNLLEIRG